MAETSDERRTHIAHKFALQSRFGPRPRIFGTQQGQWCAEADGGPHCRGIAPLPLDVDVDLHGRRGLSALAKRLELRPGTSSSENRRPAVPSVSIASAKPRQAFDAAGPRSARTGTRRARERSRRRAMAKQAKRRKDCAGRKRSRDLGQAGLAAFPDHLITSFRKGASLDHRQDRKELSWSSVLRTEETDRPGIGERERGVRACVRVPVLGHQPHRKTRRTTGSGYCISAPRYLPVETDNNRVLAWIDESWRD